MKKITLVFFVFALCCSNWVTAQYSFPAIPGPVNVAAGSPETLSINDAANSAGVASGTYDSFTVTVDWTAGGGNPWSNEADLTFVDDDESFLVNPPTTGAASSGAATTMTFSGTLATPYDATPSGDSTLDIVLNQSFAGSNANWSNIVVTLDGFSPDPNAPIIACPSDIMANSTPGNCGAAATYSAAALDPNGGSVTVVQTSPDPNVLGSGDLFPVGTTVVTFTATNDDAPNESSTCSFTITVMDVEAPTMTCPAAITQTNDAGDCGAFVTVPAPTIMDNCPVMPNSPPAVAQTPVTNFIANGGGDLIDTPTVMPGTQMSSGGDVTLDIEFDGDFGSSVESFVLAAPDGTVIYNNSTAFGPDCGGPYTDSITILEADWNDWVTNFGPDLTFTLLEDLQVDPPFCTNSYFQLTAQQGTASGATLTNDFNNTNDASGVYPVGTTTVTFTYTDGGGNSVDCTVDVTVTDDEAPMIVCIGEPGSFNIVEDFEGASVPAGWSTNVVSGGFDWTFGSGDMPTGGDFPTNAAIFDDDAIGSGELDNTVELFSPVYDLAGADTGMLSFDYAVQDFIGSGLFTVDVYDGAVWQNILTVDDTDQDPVTFGPVDVLAFANSAFQVRFTYDDEDDWAWGAGVDNFVFDYSIPGGSPFDVTLDANGMASVNIADLLSNVTDNCGVSSVTTDVTGTANFSLTTTFAGGNGLNPGGNMFDINVTNDVTFNSFDVNLDTGAAGDVEVYFKTGTHVGFELDSSAWTLAGTANVTSAGDGLPTPLGLNMGITASAGDVVAFYVTTTSSSINYTNGTAVGNVFVSDANLEVLEGSGVTYPFGPSVFAPRNFNGNVIYSAESTTPVAVTSIDVDCSDVGESTLEVRVTDLSGNESMCTATINVIDDTAPVLVCQNFTLELGADGTAMLDPFDVIDMTNTMEACGIDTAAVDIDDFDCSDIGTPVMVTVFVSDPSGNLASCMATVTVVDALEPVVTCPADQTVDPGAGQQLYEVPDYFANGEATAVDNCTDPLTVFTQDPAPGTFLGDGTYTVTLTATDDSGNTGTCTFELTVESVLGANDNNLDAGVAMFPNPAQGQVTISNTSNILLERATMYDANGRLVNTTDLTGMQGQQTIDISKLASGVYMVQIQGQDASVVKRLVKE